MKLLQNIKLNQFELINRPFITFWSSRSTISFHCQLYWWAGKYRKYLNILCDKIKFTHLTHHKRHHATSKSELRRIWGRSNKNKISCTRRRSHSPLLYKSTSRVKGILPSNIEVLFDSLHAHWMSICWSPRERSLPVKHFTICCQIDQDNLLADEDINDRSDIV